jgi:DNA-binding LacI/PurR family transcriptional regulator
VDSAVAVGAALDAGLEFDAIMCRDDLAAIGALRALQERGRRVPDDVAITGWDNTMMTSVTFPSITTIAPDMTALASRALTMLRERIEGLDSMGRHELVGFELVKRESAPEV